MLFSFCGVIGHTLCTKLKFEGLIYFVVLPDTKFEVFVRNMKTPRHFQIFSYNHIQYVYEKLCSYVKIDN